MSDKVLEELEAYVKLLRAHIDDKEYKPEFAAPDGSFDILAYASYVASLTPDRDIVRKFQFILLDAYVHSGLVTKNSAKIVFEHLIPAFKYYRELRKRHTSQNENKRNNEWLIQAREWAKNAGLESSDINDKAREELEQVEKKLIVARAKNSADLKELFLRYRDLNIQLENSFFDIQIKYLEYLNTPKDN